MNNEIFMKALREMPKNLQLKMGDVDQGIMSQGREKIAFNLKVQKENVEKV